MNRYFYAKLGLYFSLLLIPIELMFYYLIRVIKEKPDSSRFIFIIGNERSGTTYTYSKLCSEDDVAYFGNLDSLFFLNPLLCTVVQKILGEKSFKSIKGAISKTKGIYTPSECIPFWRFIFGFGKDENKYRIEDDYFDENDLQNTRQKFLKRYLSYRLILSGKKYFILKQPSISLKIKYMNQLFPKCIFLVIQRDKNDTVDSILRAKKGNETYTKFWGNKVPGWRNFINKSFRDQAEFQFDSINNIIENDLKSIDNAKSRVIFLQFDDIQAKANLKILGF